MVTQKNCLNETVLLSTQTYAKIMGMKIFTNLRSKILCVQKLNKMPFFLNGWKIVKMMPLISYCRKISRVKIGDTSDVTLFGPSVGIAVPGSLDVHISTETSSVPSMYSFLDKQDKFHCYSCLSYMIQ